MAKQLLIYRHGKSDWDATYSTDHDRPLAERGIKSASLMGKLLARSGQTPEIAVTSSALRARQTLEYSMKAGSWNCEVLQNKSLYFGGTQAVIDVINSLPEKASSAILIGHEPKWSLLTSTLIGGGDVVFKTATMVRIDFYVNSWSKISAGTGELRWLLPPSFFMKGDFSEFS